MKVNQPALRIFKARIINQSNSMIRIIAFIFGAALLVAAIVKANHYIPFQVESAAVYFGIVLLSAGLLSLIRPLKFIYIKSRKSAIIPAGTGLAVIIIGLILPAKTVHSGRPHQRIDDFLPEYRFYEYHEVIVNAPADAVLRAMKDTAFSDIPAAVWLVKIRALASGRSLNSYLETGKSIKSFFSQPILKILSRPGSGFLVLDDKIPYEYVGGMAGKPWSNDRPPVISGPDEFCAFNVPGSIRVAFNLNVTDLKNGTTRLSSETRIACTDKSARRIFSCYWRIIYPGSSIIRRVWLDAIADRAVRL